MHIQANRAAYEYGVYVLFSFWGTQRVVCYNAAVVSIFLVNYVSWKLVYISSSKLAHSYSCVIVHAMNVL